MTTVVNCEFYVVTFTISTEEKDVTHFVSTLQQIFNKNYTVQVSGYKEED